MGCCATSGKNLSPQVDFSMSKTIYEGKCSYCYGDHSNDLDLNYFRTQGKAMAYNCPNPICCPKNDPDSEAIPWENGKWQKWAHFHHIQVITL